MIYVQAEHWTGVCDRQRAPRGATAAEAYTDDAAVDDGPDPPHPVTAPTLVIWFRKNCPACVLNEPLFARLERQSNGHRVYRVQASDRRLRQPRYRDAVLGVPQFDVVAYDAQTASSTTAYGPHTTVVSIPNTDRATLSVYFPEAIAPQ